MRLQVVLFGVVIVCLSVLHHPGRADASEMQQVKDAVDVLQAIAEIPEKSIPPALLSHAQAIAVIPNAVKLGFIVAGRYGKGVMIGRDKDGKWGMPFLVTLTGGSVGWQAGVQGTDIILVFKSRRGLDTLRDGKLTLGADAAVAAGPVGRQFEAATDIQLKSEIYSYSRSRGLFAGVALEGAVLQADKGGTEALYGGRPAETINPGNTVMPPEVAKFQKIVEQMAQ